ncbi:Holin of 3TMs, for gene-transfer release [uncultured Caudovirales phage]|uniref:Holin of 3TMs, for gene-transfer release n=1 Tax=uncultured Caudovirales phage TaxID=2100421 RepID=A0A6J5T365_9CAUD|nr:Holin of 3TMs, for gene-transfer release [uncultured Caudovirales phage]
MAIAKKEEKKEDFMTSKWRPMMAISYMAICLFDFMVGPILYNVLQYLNPGQHLEMWQAVTLQGGGLYHLSMGAIIGITAFGRTKEKLAETTE